MSNIEVDHYECDWCGKIEAVRKWTTPEGWSGSRRTWESSDHYAPMMSEIRHACTRQACKNELAKWSKPKD